MTWEDWEREHPLDFFCPLCPFNIPNLRHTIEDHFKAYHPDKNPWANPYKQEEQDDIQSPASSQPSSQSDMFASQETKSKAIAESTRLDDRSQMQSTHVLEAVSLSPVVAQQEQEEMEAEEEMPTLAEATTQQLEQIPGGLYHKRLRDDKRAREEEERKREGKESPEERSPGLTSFPDNWDASSPGISATSMSWDPSAEFEDESQSYMEDLGEEYRRFGHLVLKNHPMSLLSQDEEGASGHSDRRSSSASSASTGEVLRRSLLAEELEDLEISAKEFLEEAQKSGEEKEGKANIPDPDGRVKAKRELFVSPGGIKEPHRSNTERVGEDVTKGAPQDRNTVADTIEEADNMADGDNIKLYSSEEGSDDETLDRDREEKVGHPGVGPESLKDQATAPALPPSKLDSLSPTNVEVAPESAPATPLVARASGPGKPPNRQQDAESKKEGDDEGALTGKEGEEGETVAASQENDHDERDQEEKVGHPGVGPLKDQATAPASPSSKLDLLSPTIVEAMKGIEELAQQKEEAEKQAAKLKEEIQDKIRKFGLGGISKVKKFYRMLIEKAWEEAETTKDARIMAAAKKEIAKTVTILEVIEKAATGTTSSEKTVTEKTTTEEFPDEKPPDEELATEKPDVGVKGVMAEVVEKDTIEEPLPTPPPLVVESLSDPILATDDLEEPQPPPEAPAHLPGADDHQDVEQKQDLPAQEQEKEPIENPTTPPNTAALEKPQDLAENKTAAPTGPPVLDKVASLPSQPLLVVESLSDPILATDDLEEPQPPPVLEARAHLSGAEDHQDVDQGQDLPAQGLNVDDDRDEVNAKRVQDGAGEVCVPPPLLPEEPALPYQPGDDPFSPLSDFPCGHTKRYIFSSANI